MRAKAIKVKDLRAATEASIKAVLGKNFLRRPGVLAGFWIGRTAIEKLEVKPANLAKDLAKQVSLISGIKVTAGIRLEKGGVLVGYIQPRVSK